MAEIQQYVIVATHRDSDKRKAITGPMSQEKAKAWVPDKMIKSMYVYFRVAKYPVNPQILK